MISSNQLPARPLTRAGRFAFLRLSSRSTEGGSPPPNAWLGRDPPRPDPQSCAPTSTHDGTPARSCPVDSWRCASRLCWCRPTRSIRGCAPGPHLHLRCKCRCVGVARETAAVEAGELFLASAQHTLPHALACFTHPIRCEFFVIDARHVHALRVSKRSSSGPEILF
jgi:hypothetical protein